VTRNSIFIITDLGRNGGESMYVCTLVGMKETVKGIGR
jgi:hypothetical protein